jgi:hypothetical protein
MTSRSRASGRCNLVHTTQYQIQEGNRSTLRYHSREAECCQSFPAVEMLHCLGTIRKDQSHAELSFGAFASISLLAAFGREYRQLGHKEVSLSSLPSRLECGLPLGLRARARSEALVAHQSPIDAPHSPTDKNLRNRLKFPGKPVDVIGRTSRVKAPGIWRHISEHGFPSFRFDVCRDSVGSSTHPSRSQFSTLNPLTRPNSRSLSVTMVSPSATACAAINRSFPPIGVPARSNCVRIRP